MLLYAPGKDHTRIPDVNKFSCLDIASLFPVCRTAKDQLGDLRLKDLTTFDMNRVVQWFGWLEPEILALATGFKSDVFATDLGASITAQLECTDVIGLYRKVWPLVLKKHGLTTIAQPTVSTHTPITAIAGIRYIGFIVDEKCYAYVLDSGTTVRLENSPLIDQLNLRPWKPVEVTTWNPITK